MSMRERRLETLKDWHDLKRARRCLHPHQKFQHTGRLGKELGASVTPNSLFLEAQKFNTKKEKYTAGVHT